MKLSFVYNYVYLRYLDGKIKFQYKLHKKKYIIENTNLIQTLLNTNWLDLNGKLIGQI